MIDLAAGGQADSEAASQEAGGERRAATLGVLLLALGLATLPAAIGVLALLGVVR